MSPCLAYSGSDVHDALILVDEVAVTVKLPGACDGTGELNKMIIWYFNHTVSQWSRAHKETELVNTDESC